MKDIDKRVTELYLEIMQKCKAERKSKLKKKNAELSKELGKSGNYISAFESGRSVPSLKTFLRYLLVNDFDISLLKELTVEKDPKIVRDKIAIREKMSSFDTEMLGYMVEMSKIVQQFDLRTKTLQKKVSKKR